MSPGRGCPCPRPRPYPETAPHTNWRPVPSIERPVGPASGPCSRGSTHLDQAHQSLCVCVCMRVFACVYVCKSSYHGVCSPLHVIVSILKALVKTYTFSCLLSLKLDLPNSSHYTCILHKHAHTQYTTVTPLREQVTVLNVCAVGGYTHLV